MSMDALLAALVSAPELLLLWFSVAFTLAHTAEEVWGEGGPFWDYAAPLTRVWLAWWFGALVFAGLAAALVVLAWAGYWHQCLWAVSLLAGLRLGDAVASHVGLSVLYRAGNPGLATVPLYGAEVIAVAVLYGPALSAAWFGAGCAFFALPWAVLLILRRK